MGTKHVCFTCCKAVNAPYNAIGPTKCPDCGQPIKVLSQRFRPPKKREAAKWEVAKYLVDYGFYYQHIYECPWGGAFMNYPVTMQEAREFVELYREQAIREGGVITNVPVRTIPTR